jgi:hypothetical protein
MRVTKVTPVAPVVKSQPTKRKIKDPLVATPVKVEVMKLKRQKDDLYKSDIDPAVIIHSNKTHRTASEAFRDADYATPIWKCETDWDITKKYLGGALMWSMLLGGLYLLASGFEKWVAL